MPSIGRITRVPLRDVWPHEAIDFTPWLRDNLEELNEILGITLIDAESEQPVGTFSVDLVAQTEEGPLAVIENQLMKTDHDHLGKLITYLANIDEARIAIWITPWPRAEHTAAITWLNEATDGDFYLVKLEAVRIGDSPPAPIMTLVVEPSEEVRTVREVAKNVTSERKLTLKRFWTAYIAAARTKTSLLNTISPSNTSEVWFSSGKTGLYFQNVVNNHKTYVKLQIQKTDKENNDRILDELETHKENIESEFGAPLLWINKENTKGCGIISEDLTLGGWQDEDKWSEIIDATVDMMISFHAALQPYIDQLD